MKKMAVIIVVLLVVAFSVGCAHISTSDNAGTSTNDADLNGGFVETAVGVGGYAINTDKIKCIVAVDGEFKYSYFESYEGNRIVEFYAGPTEMIIVDTSNGQSRYYVETYDDVDQIYTNPLSRIYDVLSDMDFVYIESNDEFHIYEAISTTTVVDQEQIKYNVYTLKMNWVDGQQYVYKYYEYADGSTLISAEAPNEINPRIEKDTVWVVDLDELCVHNENTGENIGIEIISVSSGMAVSPDGGETTTIEHTHVVHAYIGVNSEKLEAVEYLYNNKSTRVEILHQINITKPIITDEMIEIDHSELQSVLILIYMLESLI